MTSCGFTLCYSQQPHYTVSPTHSGKGCRWGELHCLWGACLEQQVCIAPPTLWWPVLDLGVGIQVFGRCRIGA